MRLLMAGCFLAVAGYAAAAQEAVLQPGTLPGTWRTGGPNCEVLPDWEVHEYNEDFYVLRESGCVNFEKPCLYLIFGRDKALLEDTGAGQVQTAPLVADLIAAGLNTRNGSRSHWWSLTLTDTATTQRVIRPFRRTPTSNSSLRRQRQSKKLLAVRYGRPISGASTRALAFSTSSRSPDTTKPALRYTIASPAFYLLVIACTLSGYMCPKQTCRFMTRAPSGWRTLLQFTR